MTYNIPCAEQNGAALIGETGGPAAWSRITPGNNVSITYGSGTCTISSSGGSAESMSYTSGQVQTVGATTQVVWSLSPNIAVDNAGWAQGQIVGLDDADATYFLGEAYLVSWTVSGGVVSIAQSATGTGLIFGQVYIGIGNMDTASVSFGVNGTNIEMSVTGVAGKTMNWSGMAQYIEVNP